jgi:hypothetical protein
MNRLAELFFCLNLNHQMPLTCAQAQLLGAFVGGDQIGDRGVGAFDQQCWARVFQRSRLPLSRDHETFNRLRQRLFVSGLQEFAQLFNLISAFDRRQRFFATETPDLDSTINSAALLIDNLLEPMKILSESCFLITR